MTIFTQSRIADMKIGHLCLEKGVTVKRVTRLLFVLISVAAPVWAYALGLGEIKLRSALEEPFDAEIELSSASSSVLKSLRVGLADPEDFTRVGIKPVPAVKLLRFEVIEKPGGGAAIRITTREPIHDPYLNFLVEANWGRGRALREYTVLLDPPELAGEDAPVIEAPVVATQPGQAAVPEGAIDETALEPEPPPLEDDGLLEPEPGFVEVEPVPDVAGAGAVEPELPPVDDEGLIEPEIIEPEPLTDVAEAEELAPVDDEGLLEGVAAADTAEAVDAPSAATEPALAEGEPGGQAGLDLDDVAVVAEPAAAPLSYTVKRGDTLWSIAEQMRGDRSVSIYQMMMALFYNNRHAFLRDNVNNLMAGTVLRIEDEGELTAVSSAAARSEFWEQHRAWQAYKQMLAESVVTQTDTLPEAGPEVALSEETYSAEEVAHLPEASKVAQAGEGGGAQLKLVSPEEMAPTAPASEGEAAAGAAAEGEPTSANLAQLQKMREEVLAEIESSEEGTEQNQALREKLAALEEQIASLQRVVSVKDTELAAMQQQAAQQQVREPVVQVETEIPPEEEAGLIARLNRSPQLMGILGGAVLLLLAWLWLMFRRRRERGAPEGASAAPAEEFVDEEDTTAAFYAEQDAEDDVMERVDALVEQGNHTAAVELLNDAIQREPENEDYRYRLLEILYEMKNRDAFAHQAEELYGLSGGRDSARWSKVVAMGAALLPAHALFSAANPDTAEAASEVEEFLSEVEDEAAGEWDDMDLDGELQELEDSKQEAEEEADKIIGEVLGEDGAGAGEDTSGAGQQEQDSGWDTAEFEMEDEELPDTFALEEELLEEAPDQAGDDDAGIDFELRDAGGAAAGTAVEDGAGSEAAETIGGDVLEFTRHTDEERTGQGKEHRPPEPSSEGEPSAEESLLQAETEPEEADADIEEEFELVDEQPDGDGGKDATFPSFSEYDAMAEQEDLLDEVDEIGTKLDLARAYIDMGDSEAAQSMLDEVKQDGDDAQKREADELLKQLNG